MPESGSKPFRSGYVAIVGIPNVGKSTLMNSLVGEKLAIVSPKPQTTRNKILGILSTDDMQVVFLDTPGYLNPEYELHKKMLEFSRGALKESDLILFIVDMSLSDLQPVHPILLSHLDEVKKKPLIVIFNKVDKVRPEQEEKCVAFYKAQLPFAADYFSVSAKTGINLDLLTAAIQQRLPEHEPFFPLDDLSSHPVRFFIEEIIREKIFFQYDKEIPYSTAVQVIQYEENEAGVDKIEAEIIVERSTQKMILIGRNGSKLKELGRTSREEIEKLVGKQVYLKLFVKVREKWRRNESHLKSFGY